MPTPPAKPTSPTSQPEAAVEPKVAAPKPQGQATEPKSDVKVLLIENSSPQLLNILATVNGRQQTISIMARESKEVRYLTFSSPHLLQLVAARHVKAKHP